MLKMGAVNEWIVIFVVIISSVKEIQLCFTQNSRQMLKSGEDFFMDCPCEEDQDSSNSDAKGTWLGPHGEIIGSGSEINSRLFVEDIQKGISRLSMNSLNKDLTGNYTCIFKEKNGIQKKAVYEVEVFEPLYFLLGNNSIQHIMEGENSLINCMAQGHETPQYSWIRGQNNIQEGDKYEITAIGLIVKNVTKEDEGVYICSAVVSETNEIESINISVQMWIAPKVTDIIATKGSVVTKGDLLVLTCLATGFPGPEYSWRKVEDSSQTNSTKKKTWVKENMNMIVFKSVTMDDHGLYECTAFSNVGKSSKEIFIEVLVPPQITKFDNVTVAEGSDASITCEAIGRPSPEITVTCETESGFVWKTEPIDNLTRTYLQRSVEKINRGDRSICLCVANNSVDSDQKDMFLEVLHGPSFDKNSEDVWTYYDTPVNLSCENEARPTATIQWRYIGDKNHDVQSHSEWTSYVSNNTDTYLTVNVPDLALLYGYYECVANNSIGEAKKQFHLQQGFPPTDNLSGQIDETKINITPTSATFFIKTQVSKDAPPLIGYTAVYDELENYNITSIHLNRTWALNVPYKIDKLKPETWYKVGFAALNLAGAGPYKFIEFKTGNKSAPEPPSSVHGSNPILISSNNKMLKLKYPEDNGAPIDYYHIQYCRENGECIQQMLPPATELDMNHLSPNTSYNVKIMAHNSEGNSTPAYLKILIEAEEFNDMFLSAGVIIGIAVVVVFLCILLLDILLFMTLKKGMIANCFCKKSKAKKKSENKLSRDKKGLLKNNRDAESKRTDNGHKEFEYNKSTGVITGKHSAV